MGAIDDLAVALDDLLSGHGFRGVADQSGDEDVGVALQHDQVFGAGLYQHIAVEPGQGTGAEKVMQDAIAADARIEHGERARSGGGTADAQPAGSGSAGSSQALTRTRR